MMRLEPYQTILPAPEFPTSIETNKLNRSLEEKSLVESYYVLGVTQNVFARAGNVECEDHPCTRQTVISPTGKGCLIYRDRGIHNSACCGGRGLVFCRGQALK